MSGYLSRRARASLDAEMNAAVETAPEEALYELPSNGQVPTPQELLDDTLARRAFLQRMACVGLGVAAVGLLNGCGGGNNNGGIGNPTATPSGTPGATGTPNGTATPRPTAIPTVDPRFPGIIGRNVDELVMNTTLSHEHLEVDLYRQALNAASGLSADTPLSSSRSYSLRVSAGSLNAESGQAA